MKAAVLHKVGGIPRYEDFPDPVAGEGEVIIAVKAVAVENVDKLIAAGKHYASKKFIARLPAIPAFDGIGALPDGTLVGFGDPRPPYGALAEKTVVASNSFVPIAGSPGGLRSRWPGCSAPGGSSRPAATTASCARCRPSAPTR